MDPSADDLQPANQGDSFRYGRLVHSDIVVAERPGNLDFPIVLDAHGLEKFVAGGVAELGAVFEDDEGARIETVS